MKGVISCGDSCENIDSCKYKFDQCIYMPFPIFFYIIILFKYFRANHIHISTILS